MRSGYRQIDHTADLALELWAPSEEELLRVAARAIVELLTDGARIPASDRRRVHIAAVDAEDRLVQWLNEVIVAAMVDGFLVADADITLEPTGLEAEIRGQADAAHRVVTELKSATYHDLAITCDDGWRAQVVIDV
jgi:SHS2 domain-containing protein